MSIVEQLVEPQLRGYGHENRVLCAAAAKEQLE